MDESPGQIRREARSEWLACRRAQGQTARFWGVNLQAPCCVSGECPMGHTQPLHPGVHSHLEGPWQLLPGVQVRGLLLGLGRSLDFFLIVYFLKYTPPPPYIPFIQNRVWLTCIRKGSIPKSELKLGVLLSLRKRCPGPTCGRKDMGSCAGAQSCFPGGTGVCCLWKSIV